MPGVFQAFTISISVSAANYAVVSALAEVWNHFIINKVLGIASRALSSRPPNAVTPSPELLAQHGNILRPKLAEAGLGDAERLDVFDGLSFESRTLAAVLSEGDCLTPEFPSGTVFFYDSALEPRTGDLAVIETWQRKRRSGGMMLGGMIERERVLLVKYVERTDDGRWICHSNDDPFLLMPPMKIVGRVVMAVVMPAKRAAA
ncbi:MAG: hypothetical protein IRZ28_18075 [Steroidobacteraceae bacterium]|nr:hypothetical protein [Steroidobacteraceae bacterium]